MALDKLDLDLTQAGAPTKLGLKLKNEPDFKERVQRHLRGHLSRLIEDAQGYVVELVDAICIVSWPNVPVCDREGALDKAGLRVMERIIAPLTPYPPWPASWTATSS